MSWQKHRDPTIEAVGQAARVARNIADRVLQHAAPGLSPRDLASLAQDLIHVAGAEPVLLGYRSGGAPAFPAAVCVGLNEQVINAVPKTTRMVAGDVVHVDVVLGLDGACADLADSRTVGAEPGLEASLQSCFQRWVQTPWAGRRVSELSAEALDILKQSGLAQLPEFLGHGIGGAVHQPPVIPGPGAADLNAIADLFPDLDPDPVLQAGTVIAAELTVTEDLKGKSLDLGTLDDGWSRSCTVDGEPIRAALCERMVLVEEHSNRILG